MKHTKRFISTIVASSLVLSMSLLTGCTSNKYMKPETAKNTLAVTVGEDKINLNKLVPAIFLTEITYDCQGEYYAKMYEQYGLEAGDTWGQADESGVTVADNVRTQTMDEFVKMYIFSKVASSDESLGISISDENLTKLQTNAEELIKLMSAKTKEKTGLVAEDFVEYQKMIYMANEFAQKTKDGFNVTKADVEADVDYDNVYRQYNSNYVRLSLKTKDEAGEEVDMDEEAKKTAKETMDKALADLRGGKNIDDICATYEGTEAAQSTYTYTQQEAFPKNVPVKEDETAEGEVTTEVTEATDDAAAEVTTEKQEVEDTTDEYMLKTRELANGEYSEVFEYNGYYYIALMEDNNSKEAYDAQIETEMTNLKEQKLEDYYNELKAKPEYEVKINEEVWNTLKFGELTIIHDEVDKYYNSAQ